MGVFIIAKNAGLFLTESNLASLDIGCQLKMPVMSGYMNW